MSKIQSTRQRLAFALLASFILSSLGCAFGEIRLNDPFDRQETLDYSRHRYTTLVRFSHFQKAKNYVVDDDREDFIKRMRALKDARFTDFEPQEIELNEAKDQVTIVVHYTIYTPTLPYEVTVEETQEWSRDGITNTWRVRSTFDGLQQIALN